jgi:hypothetical protein
MKNEINYQLTEIKTLLAEIHTLLQNLQPPVVTIASAWSPDVQKVDSKTTVSHYIEPLPICGQCGKFVGCECGLTNTTPSVH